MSKRGRSGWKPGVWGWGPWVGSGGCSSGLCSQEPGGDRADPLKATWVAKQSVDYAGPQGDSASFLNSVPGLSWLLGLGQSLSELMWSML